MPFFPENGGGDGYSGQRGEGSGVMNDDVGRQEGWIVGDVVVRGAADGG